MCVVILCCGIVIPDFDRIVIPDSIGNPSSHSHLSINITVDCPYSIPPCSGSTLGSRSGSGMTKNGRDNIKYVRNYQ